MLRALTFAVHCVRAEFDGAAEVRDPEHQRLQRRYQHVVSSQVAVQDTTRVQMTQPRAQLQEHVTDDVDRQLPQQHSNSKGQRHCGQSLVSHLTK